MSASTSGSQKPNYAIFRVEKIKTKGELANRAKHNDRTRVSENVDLTGPPPRSLLGEDTRTVVARAEAVFEDKGINFSQKEGKVLAVEILMTASRDFFERATPEETESWVETSKKFAQDKFGDGLIDLMLHLDEETPHIHGFALPLVEKPKLQRGRPPTDPQKLEEWKYNKAHAPMIWALDCDRYFGGDRRVLSNWQDEYHAVVARFGLARGEKKRDEDEINIGDGILIDAGDYRHSKGPRRNIKPKEGREILKKMLAAAEREKEDIQQQLEMTREHLQEAADAKRNAEKLKADQETLLASVQEDRRRQEADFIAAQRALIEERQEARRLLAEAKVEADKLTQNAHNDAHRLRAQIAEERRLNDVRLGLLERAVEVEDKHGLNLRPAGDSFSMNQQNMTADEQEAYRTNWPAALIKIGTQLALMLERIRRFWDEIKHRELLLEASKRQLHERSLKNDEIHRQNAVIQRGIDASNQKVVEREGRMALLEQQMRDREKEMSRLEVANSQASVRLHNEEQRRAALQQSDGDWAVIVNRVAEGTAWVAKGETGRFELVATTEDNPIDPRHVARLKTERPVWVKQVFRVYHHMMVNLENIAQAETTITERQAYLAGLVVKAAKALSPDQQMVLNEVKKVVPTDALRAARENARAQQQHDR